MASPAQARLSIVTWAGFREAFWVIFEISIAPRDVLLYVLDLL
jgi:hypothetical protein